MKLYKSMILGAALALSATSCNDWLDINTNPTSLSVETVSYQNLLPWCQFYMSHDYMNTGCNVSYYAGNIVSGSNARDQGAALWNLGANTRSANTYQWFFVGVGPNLKTMYEKAMADGAYHYAGASRLIKAYGFMLMTDIYGEMPYTETFSNIDSPKFDTGRTIFMGCLADIDEAIELFQKDQPDSAQPLAAGDSWNNGDAQKWLKFAYLLKARWLNHLSKKAEGSWKEGKYDTQAILDCLAKAQQSNADNTVIRHTDTDGSTHDVLGWNETVDYSTVFSCVGMNPYYYVSKTYFENLTNFDGKGIEDPRADHFIAWARSEKTTTTPAEYNGQKVKWSDDGKWRRSVGVDLTSNIFSNSGPFATEWDDKADRWFCNTKNAERLGDTIYVQSMCSSKGYDKNVDLLWRGKAGKNQSAMSGIFQVRPSSPTYLGTYWEANFIKAEVLMRKGDKAGAFAAYQTAVKAHIEAVNDQLTKWCQEDPTLMDCPSFTPMKQADIDAYCADGGALGTAGDITMGKIMTQKLMTELFMVETWNDFRRFDFDPNIFMNWNKSYEYMNNPKYLTYCPMGKGPRRWKPASIEINYNSANVMAIGAEIPGASELPGKAWYNSDQVNTLNVWWDSDQP